MRWCLWSLVALTLAATPLKAQGLRDKISDLFILGPGQAPLFLAGSGDPNNPASLQAHGLHFIPSSNAENASLISFITDALGASVANIPIGSTICVAKLMPNHTAANRNIRAIMRKTRAKVT